MGGCHSAISSFRDAMGLFRGPLGLSPSAPRAAHVLGRAPPPERPSSRESTPAVAEPESAPPAPPRPVRRLRAASPAPTATGRWPPAGGAPRPTAARSETGGEACGLLP